MLATRALTPPPHPPPPPEVSHADSDPLVYPHSSTQQLARKRKQPPVAAASPALADPANILENVVLPARNDLFARPRLTISRAPTLVPIAEGSAFHTTEQLAMNRIGFRYTPAGVTPLGSTLPCRTIESAPTNFRVCWEDRSPFVKVTADGLSLLGDTGFRSARCNAPVREGMWYMEVKIEHGGGERLPDSNKREGSHVRLGWARREAPLNGPVGLDGYSYGIRDKTGEKVTLSRPRPYGRPFTSGDVIGMYLALPPKRQVSQHDVHDPAHVRRERIAIEFKGQEYFESLEYPQSKEMISLMDYSSKSANSASVPSSSKKSATVKNLPDRGRRNKPDKVVTPLRQLPTLPGSHIVFFINGECQGIAFQDIYDYLQLRTPESSRKGKEKKRNREGAREHKENPFDDGSLGYYPFISLYNDARVRINPGPHFDYPPPPDIEALLTDAVDTKTQTWRPISERYPEYMKEQWDLDAEEEEEEKVEAIHRAALDKAEAEKKIQRDKKRQQAEARKKAKKAAAGETQREPSATMLEDDRFGSTGSDVAQPRLQALEALGDQVHSPAPTVASSADVHGVQSGYTSEHADGEGEETREGSTTYEESPQVQFLWSDPLNPDEM